MKSKRIFPPNRSPVAAGENGKEILVNEVQACMNFIYTYLLNNGRGEKVIRKKSKLKYKQKFNQKNCLRIHCEREKKEKL